MAGDVVDLSVDFVLAQVVVQSQSIFDFDDVEVVGVAVRSGERGFRCSLFAIRCSLFSLLRSCDP